MSISNYCESPPWMVSPSNRSENNSYGSPALSPGSWNVASPDEGKWNVASPQSASSGSYGADVPPTTPSSVSSGSTSTHHFIGLPTHLGKSEAIEKDDLDIRRQKVAEAKAQKLLQQNIWAGDPSSPGSAGSGRVPASPPRSHPEIDDNGYALRLEAKRRYKEKKRLEQIAAYTNNGGSASPSSSVSSPTTRVINRPRVLATTTRKKKVVPPDEDYENINDYKSVMDIEREREAERRALYLLKKFGM